MNIKPVRIGARLVPIYSIPVQIAENEEDWKFVFVKNSPHLHDGKLCLCKRLNMAVF